MPNHNVTEIVFRNVNAEQRAAILATVKGEESPIDFEVLLPMPLNCWQGGSNQKHEKAFPMTWFDWCTENWGTKWNAYGIDDDTIVEGEDSLTLTFQTAWHHPLGWMLALFNKHSLPFEYAALSEGGRPTVTGHFKMVDGSLGGPDWDEVEADEATHRRMHKLLWGVEEFTDEE